MPSGPVVIRLPRTSYLVVLFLLLGTIPLAFGGTTSGDLDEIVAGKQFGVGGFAVGPLTALLIIPILAAVFIARTATVVSAQGLRVRAVFGSRDLAWDEIRGLAVHGRAIYAVIADGAVRLPCVRLAHLGPISRLSEGRLPELPDATPKPAPQRRRRR